MYVFIDLYIIYNIYIIIYTIECNSNLLEVHSDAGLVGSSCSDLLLMESEPQECLGVQCLEVGLLDPQTEHTTDL